MKQIFTEERSHIFVKEPEGSSEKILMYVKCTYGRIFVLSQIFFLIICACTIFATFKLIKLERFRISRIVYVLLVYALRCFCVGYYLDITYIVMIFPIGITCCVETINENLIRR